MKIKKIKVQLTSAFDILEVIPNKIVVQNSLNTISLLNGKLKTIKLINFSKRLFQESTYKEFNNQAIINFCVDDDEHYLAYVNFHNYTPIIIALEGKLKTIYFSRMYYWKNNELVLSEFDGNFYKIDVITKTIHQVEEQIIQKQYPTFYTFFQKSKKFRLTRVYANKYQFLFIDEDKKQVGFYDFLDDHTIIASYFNSKAHDYVFHNGIFIFIAEEQLDIIKNNKRITLFPEEPYEFYRAQFISDNRFVVLKGNKVQKKSNQLILYEIEES